MGAVVQIDGVEYAPALYDRETFLRAYEANALPFDGRCEMFNGVLIAMSPSSNPHAFAVADVTAALHSALGLKFAVAADGMVFLTTHDMVAPDIGVLNFPVAGETLEPDKLLLAIEVADTSLRKDLDTKAPKYAAASVQELWVVELSGRETTVCRDPSPNGYRDVTKSDWNAALSPLCAAVELTPSDIIRM